MNPVQEKIQIGMDLKKASNEYLDLCELRYSKDTFVEKRTLCQKICLTWGKIDITDITPSMVSKHLQQRAMQTSKNAYNKDRKNLLAMFNWFRKTYGIVNEAVARVDRMPEERKPEYLPPTEDIDKVKMVASGQDRIMLECYYYTFARRSELFDWIWDDVNFEKEWYRLWTKKRLHGDRQADYFPMPKSYETHRIFAILYFGFSAITDFFLAGHEFKTNKLSAITILLGGIFSLLFAVGFALQEYGVIPKNMIVYLTEWIYFILVMSWLLLKILPPKKK